MDNLPKLTESELRGYFSEAYFRRGQRYYRNGNIYATQIQDHQLSGNCKGSGYLDYQVEVSLQENGIPNSRCSCPIGGGCKHVVALLLTWINEPEAFHERISVAKNLQQRSKEELIILIQQMIEREPQLENLLDIPIPVQGAPTRKKLTKATIEREVTQALAITAYDDWQSSYACTKALERVINMGRCYGQVGEQENALMAFHTLIEEVLKQYDQLWDEDGDISSKVREAGIAVAELLPELEEDGELRQQSLNILFSIIVKDFLLGGLDLSDDIDRLLIEHSDTKERRWLRKKVIAQVKKPQDTDYTSSRWTKSFWGDILLKIDEADQDIPGFLQRARTFGLHEVLFEKLVQLKRIPQAVEVAQQYFHDSDYEFFRAARAIEEAGFLAKAIEMVSPYIDQTKDARLLAWLAQHVETSPEQALNLKVRQWKQSPSMSLYHTIKSLADKQQKWSTIRTQLLQSIPSYQKEVFVDICLHEEEWEKAWHAVRDQPNYHTNKLKDRVAAAVMAYLPEHVIAYFLDRVATLLSYRERKHYATAAKYLQQIKDHYQKTGDLDTWETTISVIRKDFKRLSALQDELNKAGL